MRNGLVVSGAIFILGLLALPGCPTPTPTPVPPTPTPIAVLTATPVGSSAGPTFTVAVTAVGPSTWRYTVTTTGPSMTSLEIKGPNYPVACTVDVRPPQAPGTASPSPWTVASSTTTNAATATDRFGVGATTLLVTITCDARNTRNFYMTPADSNGDRALIGPMLGPET